jgi:Glycosyl transferases group 1
VALELPARAGCVFLFVGGTIWRKGIDLLLAGWEKAFTAEDDVLLVIKDFGVASHYRGQTQGEALRALSQRDDLAPILYLDEELPGSELPALYRAADVLVAPYRGEGFGLPILEAMACGVPAIHTAIGPSSEFVGDGGWAVPAERVSLGGRLATGELAGDGYVHEVDVQALAQTLRATAADPEDRRRRGAAGAARAQGYSWEHAGKLLDQSLRTLETEGLAPVRTSRPDAVQSGAHTVLYAPDWGDEGAWSETLLRWSAVVPANADVTLLMPVLASEAEAVMQRVLSKLRQVGMDLEAIPDLALHQQSDRDLLSLVSAADAVLLDRSQADDPSPALWRRARRLLSLAPGELEEYATTLGIVDPPIERAA